MGVIEKDPTSLLKPGERMSFTVKGIEIQMLEGRAEGHFVLSMFHGSILAMVFRDRTGDHVVGSAALVAPGIAICAQHVVADYLDAMQRGDCSLLCGGPTGETVTVWSSARVAYVEGTDLALLYMDLASRMPAQNQFFVAHLTTRTPAVDERVVLYGLPGREGTVMPVGGDATIPLTARYTSGKVIEIYHDGRDKVMMPGPCFAVECAAFGGMSGGPVFDERGCLIGIVSTSYEGENPIAYVSSLWPALRLQTFPVWPAQRPFPAVSLVELSKTGMVHLERPDAVESAPTSRFQTNYLSWT